MQSIATTQIEFVITNPEPMALDTGSVVATICHVATKRNPEPMALITGFDIATICPIAPGASAEGSGKIAFSSSQIKRLMSAKAINNMMTCLMATAALFSAGCGPSGPKTYQVQGRVVTESGKPVEMGSVEFRSEGSDSRVIARGKIKADGSFSLSTFSIDDGAIAGRHDVIVQQMIIAEGFGKSHEHGPRVPAAYSDYGSSGLTAEVKKNDDNFVNLMIRVLP